MRVQRSPQQPRRPGGRRRSATVALALGAVGLLAAGCTDSDSDGPDGSGGSGGSGGKPMFALASSLQGFDACSDLLAYLKGEATERVTAYGLPGIGFVGFARAESAMSSAGDVKDALSAPTTVPAAGMTPGVDYSTTNTVEAGIDEGDTVKTDGEYLYLLAQGRLQIVSADPGDPEVVASLQLPGFGAQLVKSGDRLIVTGQPDASVLDDGDGASSDSDATTDARDIGMPVPGWSTPASALWQIDVSDPAAPELQRQLIVDGNVLNIRVTDDVARFVVQTTPSGLPFVTPTTPFAEARALESNRQVIAESEIDDWLGGYRLLDGSGKQISDGQLSACDAVSRPPEFHGFATTTVLSVDLARGLGEPNGATVLADGQRVYASPGHLYVAIGSWQDPSSPFGDGSMPAPDGDATTAIHRFTFDGDRSTYTATGTVVGNLMNDFSMSEYEGVLRVATTNGLPWGPSPESESFVTTLQADGNELKERGRIGELGKGEQIRAVRFIDSNAYVVTFRQTDPLYVVDLADPATPRVAGELKMNGYSGYLHPIGPDRLLGVGQDADDQGRITGALVATFDVSDPAKPTRTAAYTLPSAWLNTEWDYQSFLWWGAEDLALMTGSFADPATPYMPLGGVLGLDVGDTTITERGRILPVTAAGADCGSVSPGASGGSSDAALPTPPETTIAGQPAPIPRPECFPYAMPITRTVVVGPSVFSISDAGVQASDLKTLAPQGTATF